MEAYQNSILRGAAGTVYRKVSGGVLYFSPPTSGLTVRVEGKRQRFTNRDKKGCKEESSIVVFWEAEFYIPTPIVP